MLAPIHIWYKRLSMSEKKGFIHSLNNSTNINQENLTIPESDAAVITFCPWKNGRTVIALLGISELWYEDFPTATVLVLAGTTTASWQDVPMLRTENQKIFDNWNLSTS